ncbi:MAG: hypothetical protein M3296_08525 [Actinomycetota bacterium]|nr:hypothetical protein [Actinomycetota bacterium]
MTSAGVEVPERLLPGSGPSPGPDRVLTALAPTAIGHMDRAFAEIMNETAALLPEPFVTDNPAALPLSGGGSAGIEALIANFVGPGERVVCGVHGRVGVMGVGAQREVHSRLVFALAQELRAEPSDALAALDEGRRA